MCYLNTVGQQGIHAYHTCGCVHKYNSTQHIKGKKRRGTKHRGVAQKDNKLFFIVYTVTPEMI